MAITPSGYPVWQHVNTHVDYGGDLNKRNFLSQGVVDAQTDVGADQFSRMVADMEAIGRTAPFAIINYTCNDAAPAAPTINRATLMTGIRSTSYAGDAAPTGFPSAVRNGTGDVTFSFSGSYLDAYGVSGTMTISTAIATVSSTTAAIVTIGTGGGLQIKVWDAAGVALGNKTVTVTVWATPSGL